jgi:hypothetical protein
MERRRPRYLIERDMPARAALVGLTLKCDFARIQHR